MRQIVADHLPDTPDQYNIMARYPLGWVDATGQPYNEATGKRIRPLLLLLCAEVAGGNWKRALPAAAAVELLHNFSLVHDDIQDNSPTRHNRPTVWKTWDAANAINTGDALFTLSYVALNQLSTVGVSPETTLAAWQIFNSTCIRLTHGQHLDMSFESQRSVTVDEYMTMIHGKTAALLAACAQLGALIATDDLSIAAHYETFGLNLGLAFQIRDDILGIWGDSDVTGKSSATDIVSRKKSLPVLYGLEHSKELTALYARETFEESHVAQAVSLLDAVNARDYATEQEKRYYDRAMEAIDRTTTLQPGRDNLQKLIDALLQRQY